MSMWDDLPAPVQNSGALDALRPLLEDLDVTGPTETTDDAGTWDTWTFDQDLTRPLALNPRTGGFGSSQGSTGTPIEFTDPHVDGDFSLHKTGPGGARDDGWRLRIASPSFLFRVPFLRGAMLDGQGQLRADPAKPQVGFVVPKVRFEVKQLAGASVGMRILSATTTGTPVDEIYEFIRMDPPYALVGPSDCVGFAFRTAVLDLSGTAGPGVPAGARAMPGDWQGFFLPEARLFVAPSGMEGIAVSAGVRNLWIGIGAHEGVTGVFEAEVVNRGTNPAVRVHFRSATGEYFGDPGPATAMLPEQATMFVDADHGLAPLTTTIVVDGVAATPANTDRTTVTTPATGTVAVTITVIDAQSHSTVRTFTLARRADPATPGATGMPVTITETSHETARIVITAQTSTAATVALSSGVAANWSWSGGSANAATSADVPVAGGATVSVTAVTTSTAAQTLDAYFRFDHPKTGERVAGTNPWRDFIGGSTTITATPDVDRTHLSGGPPFSTEAAARRSVIGAGTQLTVEGFASFEGIEEQAGHNLDLSTWRRDAMIEALRAAGYTNLVAGTAHGATTAEGSTDPGASHWWHATATSGAGAAAITVTADLHRDNTPPPHDDDPRPHEPGRPDCFHLIGVRVELVRSTFVRCEVYGEFDIETATERRLAAHGTAPLRAGQRPNPSDGICTFLVRLRIAEDQGAWDISGEFRAKEGDLDGLAEMTDAQSNGVTLNILGALSILAPLTSAATELSPAAGAVVALGSVALGASDLIKTKRLTLRGGQVIVSQGVLGADGITTVSDQGTQVSILLDVEVAFWFDLTLIRIDPNMPVTTRYKAIGVRSKWGTGSGGSLDYVPLPVFDPSRGYSLDIPAGSMHAVPPLDDILRIMGVRVSRDNPTYLEVEVGLGLDLGIITIETIRVRARIDGPPLDLQITKLAASIDIPNVITGRGEVAIIDGGFSGALDIQIIPVKIRGSLTFTYRSVGGVSGVLLGAEIEFPVPLVLGSSGLGIYGFLVGVGINHKRIEGTGQVPALTWLKDQLGRPGGIMNAAGWELHQGGFAFAAGVLVGTLEGGFVIHLKGLVVVEVPGPRLLFVMKADVIKMPPALKDANQSATFLAVLDLDFGRGTITIGIVAEYEIESILKIRVPVTAFFDTNDVQGWLVELGNYQDRVTVEVLEVISGSGYLMIHGNGITHAQLPVDGFPAVGSGLAIATGFHISAVLMGSKAVGLYLEVAAGFDALVGFDPFFIAGKIYARGELRLFIISIGASAELTVMVGKRTIGGVVRDDPYIHGEVCGSIDLFFFEIKGCVSLTIGAEPEDNPTAKPLVAGLALVSRSPALVEGTATERAIDAKIGDGVDTSASNPPALPVVPLDAVPVLTFTTPPRVAANGVLGGDPKGSNGATANPWMRIGDRWWRYDVSAVTLTGGAFIPPPPTGKTPSTWWTGAPVGTSVPTTALALLNWVPTPFSRAIPYGEQLTTQVTERWGTVCHPAAPAAPVLWTFDRKPAGPSVPGWRLDGIPWPDPPGTVRSEPVDGRVHVTEPWRSGDAEVDLLQGTDPAVVLADAVPCPRTPGRTTGRLSRAFAPATLATPSASASAWTPTDEATYALIDSGVPLADVMATRATTAWSADTGDHGVGCRGAVLRSPRRDATDPAPYGTEDDRAEVKEAWSRLGFTPHDLRDAVRFRPGAGLSGATFLLLVPERAMGGGLVLRSEAADGTTLDEHHVGGSDLVSATHPVPPQWLDTTGPWADPVLRAATYAARLRVAAKQGLMFVLVDLAKLPDGTDSIVIGWEPAIAAKLDEPFYVVAATALVASEAWREDWDTTQTTADQDALETALTQDPDDRALLQPGQTWTVSVTWQAQWRKQDARPNPGDAGTTQPAVTQSFQFRTAAASAYPKVLSPWLVATAPGMDDVGVFCREPVRIAFATQKVAALYDAHGRSLKAVVRAASGSHPPAPGSSDPGSAYDITLDPEALLTPSKDLVLMTPWEETVRDVSAAGGMPCIDTSGERVLQDILTLPYDFEPLTDYLVDIHAVAASESISTDNRIHRIGFTTSRFLGLADLVSFVGPATVRGRLVPTGSALSALPTAPTGDQVDTAYQAAGLTVPEVPSYPAVELLWSGDATPQPVALVVECSEPLWRSRVMPEVVTGPIDQSDPTHKWWKAVRDDWLALQPSTAPVVGGDLPRATVSRIIRCPGGTRAIALLAPGSRGSEVRLDLVVAADPLAGAAEQRQTCVRMGLLRAPWEVED
jgi:large repetitive protein